MDQSLQPISLPEYAKIQARFGAKIVTKNGRFWRQVRPFFFRPLLPVENLTTANSPTGFAWPTACQYVLPDGQQANSTINFIMLDNLASYSLDSLTHKRRQMITRAAQQFEIRRLRDPQELKDQGHNVYLSFQHRTGYSYRTDRTLKAGFDHWVDNLFANPQTILLGGFGPNGLGAISNSYWVNQTLVYSTLICETEAMKKNLGELMFHEVRLLAGRQSGLSEIFVRSYQGNNSLDRYYLLRGCQLVRRPARLEMPAAMQALMRTLAPQKYQQLRGDD